jgi:peptide deformylase
MALKIAQLGQPILRAVAREVPVEEIATPAFQSLLQAMAETMTESKGVGLAAPQVFEGKRVFLARVVPAPNENELPGIEVFVNPRITAVSEERALGWEGCLSFMELSVLVPRHEAIVVEYQNAAGVATRLELAGFPARVVQHENDHLDGILIIDRARSTLDIVKTSEMETVIEERKKRRAERDTEREAEREKE